MAMISRLMMAALLVFVAQAALASGATTCSLDSQCTFGICRGGSCVPRSIWTTFRWHDAVGMAVIFVGAMLAAGGGLGGGGVFIPVLVLIIGMPTKQAVPVSQAAIFGGSIINIILNSRIRNPIFPEKALVDYSIVCIFTPMMLLGTLIGVMLNIVFPTWLVTAILIITMVFTTYRTALKTRKTWNEEHDRHIKEAFLIPLEMREAIRPDQPPQQPDDPKLAQIVKSRNRRKSLPDGQLKDVIKSENSAGMEKALIGVVWVSVLLFNLIRNGKGGLLIKLIFRSVKLWATQVAVSSSCSPSIANVRACSLPYWLLTLGVIIILSVLTFFIGRYLSLRRHTKIKLGWTPESTEVDWSIRNTLMYPLFASFAGLLGGLLGIGGGMVLAPLLLELGFHSQVVSGTSATAVLLTSSSAIVLYIVLGMLDWSYSIVLFFLGAVATFVGQTSFGYLIKKYDRTSFIAGSITLLLFFATILLAISGVLETMSNIATGARLGFSAPC